MIYTNFDKLLAQAKVQDMMEQAAESRANRNTKGGLKLGTMLIVATPFVLWVLWALIAG